MERSAIGRKCGFIGGMQATKTRQPMRRVTEEREGRNFLTTDFADFADDEFDGRQRGRRPGPGRRFGRISEVRVIRGLSAFTWDRRFRVTETPQGFTKLYQPLPSSKFFALRERSKRLRAGLLRPFPGWSSTEEIRVDPTSSDRREKGENIQHPTSNIQ